MTAVELKRRARLRVAVIAYHSSPLAEPGAGDSGGMTVYVRAAAEAMSAQGIATDIYTRATEGMERVTTISPGVRVIGVEAGPPGPVEKERLPDFIDDFARGVRAHAQMQRIRYDVIHSHYWQSGLAARRLAAAWDVPFVHSAHTLARVKNSYLAPGDAPEPDARIEGELGVIADADVLITSTDDELQHLACLYGASHDRLKTVHPGVDHRVFRPGDMAEARSRLGFGDEAVLLYVGRIQPLKGLDLGIRATERLTHALDRGVRFVLVGGASGPMGEQESHRLKALASELHIADSIDMRGPQPHHLLRDFYVSADVAVISSYSESFGLTALEAHSCGTPIVGSPVGGLSHVVRDGESGFLIDQRDPDLFAARAKPLLSDPAMRRVLRTAPRSRLQPISPGTERPCRWPSCTTV